MYTYMYTYIYILFILATATAFVSPPWQALAKVLLEAGFIRLYPHPIMLYDLISCDWWAQGPCYRRLFGYCEG